MNQNQRAIEITMIILKEQGIRHVVINPGGTNIALVRALQEDSYFTLYSIVDERSAIYFAIGLYLQTGEIIATSCTSAQATRNYVPGLTEAYYKRVPILAITMEKHPRFVGQEYMQAPDQTSLPRDSVKKTFEIPFVSDVHDEYACIRIVNEAICEITNKGYGPVQLCIPWLDFSIKTASPAIRTIKRFEKFDTSFELNGKRIMVVIGEHRPFSVVQRQALENFAEKSNCVIYTNHLSNYHGKYAINANLEFTVTNIDDFVKNYAPDLLISIGGQTGDYPFYLMLSKPELSNTEHWRIEEDGKIIDTYDKLTKVFECSIESFFNDAAGSSSSGHEYYQKFSDLCNSMNRDVDVPFSNAFAAQILHNKLPKDSIVQFSILNSLRVWNLFAMDSSIQCYSNVGAFGIDGGMSTLIGQSVATEKLCFMIIGDLAFYYDMNSLGIRYIKNNVRILLINNNGGVEFKLNDGNHKKTDQYIAASGHFKNAMGWAETCGFRYIGASSKEEFQNNYEQFIAPSEKPIVFELFVTDRNDYLGYQNILDANRKIKKTEMLKKGINRFIRR